MGLPIITTNSPGCREVVENNVNGFLIPSHNAEVLSSAISCLVKAPELCLRFGQASRQRAEERFDTIVISGQTRAIYKQFISNFSGRNL